MLSKDNNTGFTSINTGICTFFGYILSLSKPFKDHCSLLFFVILLKTIINYKIQLVDMLLDQKLYQCSSIFNNNVDAQESDIWGLLSQDVF